MASLIERRRRSGVAWQVRWRQDGTWHSDTFGNKRQALRFQCDVEDAGNRWPAGWVPGYDYAAAAPAAPDETSFAELASRYLLTRNSVSSYQLARYESMAARLGEHFPAIADVDDESIAAWVRDCQERGVAAKTIKNYHGPLHGICGHAVRKGLLPANPCALTRLPKVSAYTADGEPIACFLEPAEFVLVAEAMCASAAYDWRPPGGPGERRSQAEIATCGVSYREDRDLITLAVHTGLRWGEISALRVRDIDLAGRRLSVFADAYGAKFAKAVAKITDDLDVLLAFYDYPAEHWVHLRTTNPIESTFATVRHRSKVTKGPGSRAAGLAMAFKLVQAAQDRWRAVKRPAPGRTRPRRRHVHRRQARRTTRRT